MRQAGRHMQVYRDLCKKHTTFRQRSEIPEVAVEVSLQPYEAYKTDGCILFSDILTPFPGMGCDFTIDEKLGPVMPTIRTWDELKNVRTIFCYIYFLSFVFCVLYCFNGISINRFMLTFFSSIYTQKQTYHTLLPTTPLIQLHSINPDESCPFVGEALRTLRKEVSPETAVLGFVGCPYTLATYLVEGKTTRDYMEIKKMAWNEPDLLHAMLQKLADNIGDYALYQIENGAQLIQIFDSWAGELSARDYDTFAAPYQKMVLDKIKAAHPEIPTVIYIKHSGALIERMAKTGVDVVSLDWTVDMAEGRERIANGRKAAGLQGPGGVQGNLDPGILYGSHETIKERAEEILRQAGPTGHVMNLGHGIEATTPQENAAYFIETVRNFRH